MANDSNSMIFNNVFQTLKIDCPRLIIPMANEVHGMRYTKDEKVSLNNNEHFRKKQDGLGARNTDSNLVIGRGDTAERYHFECQRRPDSTMIRRMVEYDMLIAVENGKTSVAGIQMKIPHSAVIYLEHTQNTPDEMDLEVEMSENNGLHKIPALKVQNYSVDELFEKKLYILIPFHILVYKNEKMGYNEDKETIIKLQKIYTDIAHRLDEAVVNDNLEGYEYRSLLDMTMQIVEYEMAEYEKLRKAIGEILLGGRILNYETKDAYCDGREEGMLSAYTSMVKDGLITLVEAAKRLNITEEEIKARM